MNYTRNFLDLPYLKEDRISLEKINFHHEINVLRKKAGDRFIVFDGQGQSGLVEILEINKKTIDIEMKEIFPVSKREGLAIDLGQSLIKNDPFNIAVQLSLIHI